MRFRKGKALLLGPAVVFTLLVPAATQGHAAGPAVAICAVAGQVAVSDGVGSIPPSGTSSAGSYTFDNVAVVCAGSVTGAAVGPAVGSSGVFNASCGANEPLFGSFCPSSPQATNWHADGFQPLLTQNNVNCSGWIGGPQLIHPDNARLLNPFRTDWSLSFATTLASSLSINCKDGGGNPGSMDNGWGIFTAQAQPDPQNLAVFNPVDSTTTYVNPNTSRHCGRQPNLVISPVPDVIPGPIIWACGIILEGVTVTEAGV